jgi:4-amino-4-deoxy-L-arabinose transferase-like glycosyltransferase
MERRFNIQVWLAPALLTLLLACVVYWPFLGYSGLSQSEGHRAIPGWQMMDRGEYFVTRLFGHVYLRKPPGMPWAVALASSILGQTEFAARAVSAAASTLSALASFFAASMWFGRRAGLIAGAAFVVTPLFWYPARSSEIEALNNFWSLCSMIGLLAVIDRAARGARGVWNAALLTGVCIAAMLLTKGPAGLPCLGGAIVAGLTATRQPGRVARNASAWLALLVPGIIVGLFAWIAFVRFHATGEVAITEPPGHFLWNATKIGSIFLLPLVALASALPVSIALAMNLAAPSLAGHADTRARAILLACPIALLIYTASGVANPRYAMPALTILPLCCGVLAARWTNGIGAPRRIAAMVPRIAGVAVALLTIGGIAHNGWLEYRREFRTSGRAAGIELASHLPDGAEVYAFEMIDQRPELLLYAEREAKRLGKTIHVQWKPYPAVFGKEGPPPLPKSGGFLLLRDDTMKRDQYPPELPEFERHGIRLGEPLMHGRVHNFTFALYQFR